MENLAPFIQAAAGAGFIAKMTVDGIRMAVDMPRWMPILLAFVTAQAGEFLLLLSQNAEFTRSSIASAIVIGLIAWAIAIGSTALQTKAAKVDERIDAALAAPQGTTRTELEAAVKENQ
jgi:hypothetical protein